jgi:glycosyltransferase involved in cell wall biosynthesis
MSASIRLPVSVVIMTLNEAENLPRCLNSVAGLWDELFILDSFSSDRTLDIARSFGARVEQHEFGTFYEQRSRLIQWAKHDRILLLDADEWLSPELRQSIASKLDGELADTYFINRLNRIGQTWIRHGNWYPDRKVRLFDRRKIEHIDDDPHDRIEPIADASIGYIHGDILHQADRDLSDRFSVITRYSERAAQSYYKRGKKTSLARMYFKPLGRFLTGYIIRGGFLDGYYGWFIARSEAIYVWMREVRLWELHKQQGHQSGNQ